MNDKEKIQSNPTETQPNLELSFDVGHSSLGWAVLQSASNAKAAAVNLLGCGAVIFRADDCLASTRRSYRRQRRHIRSTRQRIKRMKSLLAHLRVLTPEELDRPGCAWPWQLAARVLAGGKLLSWPELWDVLRWYAHNRGYDGNRRWSAAEADSQDEDTEKEENARTLMQKHGASSMAETFCRELGVDPMSAKKHSSMKRFKGLNAAFPRAGVEGEVRSILQKHAGKLPAVDANLERALLGRDNRDKTAWQAIPCPHLKLPNRYQGGLLFGQLVPRFDNRIISKCPITGQKVPSRNCPEFLRFRWAMQLANIRVGQPKDRELRPLSVSERESLDKIMRQQGSLTPGELKKHTRQIAGCSRDNLETMLMHPDAKEALLLDPVQKLVNSDDFQPFWVLLPERLQKRLRGQWRRAKTFTLAQIREQLSLLGSADAFDALVEKQFDAASTNTRKKDKPVSRAELLNRHFPAKPFRLEGRAAYARPLLVKAWEEVMAGGHPKEADGCLFVTEAMRQAQLNREISEQTNNHLVRHRLLILERLLRDITKEYAGEDKSRVARITIEVNRDLREMSGKDSKAKDREMREKLGNIRAVEEYVLDRLPEKYHGQINGSYMRKARVADDLDWKCPYTGEIIQPIHLLTGAVDVDHIIPYSVRPSNALDSLVITFSTVNKMKGKRTAMQFMKEMAGKPVCLVDEKGRAERIEGMPGLSLLQLRNFKSLIENLKVRGKGEHDQDAERRLRRKRLLELEAYEAKEFLPRDLTQTSQLVRLGAQVLRRAFQGCARQPVITSLPGSVTGEVRKAWRVLGCLSLAAPQVLDENGEVRKKDDIRDITHLHHALDACVLGFASHFIPNNGRVWELIVKRNLKEDERKELFALDVFGFDSEGRFRLRDLDEKLKEQIRQRLAEKRVVQHLPSDMNGLAAEETVWRVLDPDDTHSSKARQIKRWLDATGAKIPTAEAETVIIVCRKRRDQAGSETGKTLHQTKIWRWVYQEIAKSKLIGLEPESGKPSRLKSLKAAKILGANYGLAIDPHPEIIRPFKVWHQLTALRLKNGGKRPRILRNGQLVRVPRGSRSGIWKIMSTKDTEAYGLALDLALPDRIKHERGNAPVEKLLEDGLEIVNCGFVGIDSSGVTTTEAKKRPRKPKTTGTDTPCPSTSSA